jgi:oxygen-independent coproporphyrinogen-3 oxidase
MAGIYIHIPFCKKACHYCNFHFSTNLQAKNELIESLVSEIEIRKQYLNNERIDSIYFGGGTPSLLSSEDIALIMQSIKKHFYTIENLECTLEANPDDITIDKLWFWKENGINRLSIGIQSFFDEDLLYMNRSHNAMQAKECVQLAYHAGITNMSIDLIFGYPLLSDEKWESNLSEAFNLPVTHISCYAMTVEPKTALENFIRTSKERPIDAGQSARQFEYTMEQMGKHDFQQYEISNYAKKGSQAIHNSNYWRGIPYLGIGPSAHSFNGESRQWNISNNAIYIKSLQQGIIPFEIEILSQKYKLNEAIMVSLRMHNGLNISNLEANFPNRLDAKWYEAIDKKVKLGLLHKVGNEIRLTLQGKLFADDIASDLFLLDD